VSDRPGPGVPAGGYHERSKIMPVIRPEFHHHRDDAPALGVPAVRLVVARAYVCEDGEVETRTFPVVALQTFVRRHYVSATDASPFPSGTEQQLLDGGWQLREVEVVQTALYVDRELGLVRFGVVPGDDAAEELVACPWPPEEDEGAPGPGPGGPGGETGAKGEGVRLAPSRNGKDTWTCHTHDQPKTALRPPWPPGKSSRPATGRARAAQQLSCGCRRPPPRRCTA
jgi:hypothetical protein